MVRNFGIFNPYLWHTSIDKIRPQVEYKVVKIDFLVVGSVTSVTVYDIGAGTNSAATKTESTWTLKDESLTVTRITKLLTIGHSYYMKMIVDGTEYFSDAIKCYDCGVLLTVNNSCNDILYNWETGTEFQIAMINPQQTVPQVQTQTVTRFTATGTKERKTTTTIRYGLQFIQPKSYANILHACKGLDILSINGQEIKNLEVEVSDAGTTHSSITLTYEFPTLTEGDNCCTELDIDDISIGEEPTPEECEGWTMAIAESGGTLSINNTDPPAGTQKIRWYRNGALISTSTTINVSIPGTYRVDVTIGSCKKSDTYYLEDVCNIFRIRVFNVGNYVDAEIEGVPSGCTPEISVTLEGVEVATTLPYLASETGTYFVRVTACDCVRSGGVNILALTGEDCDFTASIVLTGSTLSVLTSASSPTYLWEFEDNTGRTTIGTSATQVATEKGIYFLTITEGDCTKELYKYLAPSTTASIIALYRVNGTVIVPLGINLLAYSTPGSELLVIANGTVLTYVSGTPAAPGQYTINASGNIVLYTALTNGTLIIKTL